MWKKSALDKLELGRDPSVIGECLVSVVTIGDPLGHNNELDKLSLTEPLSESLESRMSSHPGKATTSAPDRRRRRYPRYRCDFSVVVTLLAGKNYQKLNAHCKDLSEAGIGAIVAAELASGEVVSLSFSLPGSIEPWDVKAVLRHRRGYHYGFEFLSLALERIEVLKNFIQSRERAD